MMPFSFYNITSLLENNTVSINFSTGGLQTITLVDGFYTQSDFFSAIESSFGILGYTISLSI